MSYTHQHPEWPTFTWKQEIVASLLSDVRLRQGILLGQMKTLGFSEQDDTLLKTLAADVAASSELEGARLDDKQVRSSVARRLGLNVAGLVPSDRRTDGVVEMLLEAASGYDRPLTEERLLRWHTGLFATEEEPRVGRWRDDALEAEMAAFFSWVNGAAPVDPLLKAALVHLRLAVLRPFADGSGRIARAAADWALARSEGSPRRFYSMSAQILNERGDYDAVLEATRKGGLDVTDWALWFLGCLGRAVGGAEESLAAVLRRDRFWMEHAGTSLNKRQRGMLDRLLDGTFTGKLTSTKWAMMTYCSQDTAQRDIAALAEAGILSKEPGGGRSTSYSLAS